MFENIPSLARWLLSTNHKDIGRLYVVFAILAGIVGFVLSVIIRIQLNIPSNVFLSSNWQFYNVVITAHAFIMIFFFVFPALLGGFGNIFVSFIIGAPD